MRIIKTIILLLVVVMGVRNISAQTYGINILSAGAWIPAPSSASGGSPGFNPPSINIYCYNTSTKQWVPADSSCFGGGSAIPSGPAGGDLGSTYPNPTVVGSHIVSGTIGGNTAINTTGDIAGTNLTSARNITAGVGFGVYSGAGVTEGFCYVGAIQTCMSTLSGADFLWATAANTYAMRLEQTALTLSSGLAAGWSSNSNPAAAGLDTAFSRDLPGVVDVGNGTVGDKSGTIIAAKHNTPSPCASSASPAVCGSSAAGFVAIPTGTTSSTLTVNTTAVTANSQIFFYPDDTLGTQLGSITCNSTLATLAGGSFISARTAGTSFTITFNGTIVTNKVCGSFYILN